ncbi:FAD-dependent monooxygenase [Streptomyces mirabilis]|uniref:FAD-dependent monooxygenase n=1 Tax=Streptomyces mirabilis TaxID=68239 RepID=UPI003328E9FB
MNTGIQDALNLGWQFALVCQGAAPEEPLETYEAERARPAATSRAAPTAPSPSPPAAPRPSGRPERKSPRDRSRWRYTRPEYLVASSIQSPNSASTTATALHRAPDHGRPSKRNSSATSPPTRRKRPPTSGRVGQAQTARSR